MKLRILIAAIALTVITSFVTFCQGAAFLDNFTANSSLNTALWTENSNFLSTLGAASASPPATVLTPTLSFGPTGMQMSGVNSPYEFAGIQALATFAPPFTLTTVVEGTVSDGNTFRVFLASGDLSQWFEVEGNLNPNNGPYYGVWINYTGSGQGLWQLGDALYGTPSIGVFYTVRISVGANGNASVSLIGPGGATLASQSGLPVGTGPFYAVLASTEGAPYTVGPNVAVWQSVNVTTSGSSDTVNLSTACINGLQVDINGGAFPGVSVTSIDWNWGDGQETTGFFPQSHTYSTASTYVVQVTAHYNDGSSASASQNVTVGPNVHSNCDSLTISAGQDGTVCYQASVGTGTVPAGGSVTLQLDYADDLSLTASPFFGGSFVNWSVSSGITGIGGTAVDTTSPSITIVVADNSQIAANFSLGGAIPTSSPLSFQLPANARWFDTGIDLLYGEPVTIIASGTVDVSTLNPAYRNETPSGQPGGKPLGLSLFVAPDLPPWSLVGRIGSSGQPFEVGTGTNLTTSPGGRLYLSVNDNFFFDNSGFWSVTVTLPAQEIDMLPSEGVCQDISLDNNSNSSLCVPNGNPNALLGQLKLIDNLYGLVRSGGEATMDYNVSQRVLTTELQLENMVQTGGVAGYPEILYGYKPWDAASSIVNQSFALPMKVADFMNLANANGFWSIVDYTITPTPPPNQINFAYDIWISQAQYPQYTSCPAQIPAGDLEVMIWLYNNYDNIVSSLGGKAVCDTMSVSLPTLINGHLQDSIWNVYVVNGCTPPSNSTALTANWTKVYFVLANPTSGIPVGVDLSAIIGQVINVLGSKGWDTGLLNNYFLEDIELGSEFSTNSSYSANYSWTILQYSFLFPQPVNLQGANLSGENLQDADLQGANLQEANLSGADLQGANLSNANLQGANLQGANLRGADFDPANLSGANLSGANASGADFHGADLQGAILEGTILIGANLKDANLSGADLSKAELLFANLQGADLQNANFTDAKLCGANLQGANTTGAIFTGAKTRDCYEWPWWWACREPWDWQRR